MRWYFLDGWKSEWHWWGVIKRKPSGIVTASLLLLLTFVLWRCGGGRKAAEGRAPASERSQLTALTSSGADPAAPRRRIALRPAESEAREFDPYEEWETEKILSHFAIPPGEFSGASLPEVIDWLREVYAENGGRNIAFRVEPGADAGYSLEFEFGNISAGGLMELVAGLGGYDLLVGAGEVVFRRKVAADDDDRLVTLRVAGQPDLIVAWEREEEDGVEAGARDDERSLPTVVFEKWGIGFADGGEIILDPDTGDWLITHEGAQLARVQAAYDHLTGLHGLEANQILLSGKVVSVEGGTPIGPQTFANESAYRTGLDELYTDGRSGDVASSPSIVTTGGQRAKIEIIRELVYPSAFDAAGAPTDFDVHNVGYTMEVAAVLVGLDRVLLTGTVGLTTVGDQTLRDVIPVGGGAQGYDDQAVAESQRSGRLGEDPFRTLGVDFDGELFDGNTAGFSAAEEAGTAVQQFISVRRLNDDGTPLLPD